MGSISSTSTARLRPREDGGRRATGGWHAVLHENGTGLEAVTGTRSRSHNRVTLGSAFVFALPVAAVSTTTPASAPTVEATEAPRRPLAQERTPGSGASSSSGTSRNRARPQGLGPTT